MILPSGPLRLKSSFVWLNQLGGVFLLLAAAGVTGGFAWLVWGNVSQLQREIRVWESGVEGRFAHVTGEVRTSKFIFNEYKLDVSYMDASGGRHQYKLEFDTIGTKVDQNDPVVIRYLNEDPTQYALSWAMNVKTSRWLSAVFLFLAGAGLFGGSLLWLGIYALRLLGDARRCARRSDEIVVRITKVVQQNAKGKVSGYEYHFAGETADGRPVTGKRSFPIKHQPLFADATQQTMVARVSQDNLKRPVIVRADFHPFELTTEEQAAARSAIQRAVAPAGSAAV